jgi:hypothetical protein
MLSGTADLDAVAAGAPAVDEPATEALLLPGAEVLQVAWEVVAADRDALFPPGLHPVDPPVVTWSFLRVRESVHGPFTLAETRLVCRSGVRTRGLHVAGFADRADVALALTRGWGYDLTVADVTLARRYDGTTGRVVLGGRTVLDTGHHQPVRLSPGDVQYTPTMHPAVLPRGLRLLQVERDHAVHRAERGRPFLEAFDAAAVGDPRLVPSAPVSASSAVADVTLRPVRFACRADVWAFDGTERLTAE